MVNKQGQTRIAQYFVHQELEERIAMEGEIIRKCLSRTETQVRAQIWCPQSSRIRHPSWSSKTTRLSIGDMLLSSLS